MLSKAMDVLRWECRSANRRAVPLGVAVALLVGGCASAPQQDAYTAFLQTIAAECKPLIIGSDDIGQAIVFNGLGALPENYNNFLGKTAALYAGSISRDLYRDTLTSSLGGGSYNARSFNCIFGHLPPAGAKP